MNFPSKDYRWLYRFIFILWLSMFFLHANNVYFIDVRDIHALRWTGFVADAKKMSNSVPYRSFFGGYGEQLLISFVLSLVCLALFASLILRRILVAFLPDSRQIESPAATLVATLLVVIYLMPVLFSTYDIFYSATGTRMSGMPSWLKLFVITVGWPTVTIMLIDLNLTPQRSRMLHVRLK